MAGILTREDDHGNFTPSWLGWLLLIFIGLFLLNLVFAIFFGWPFKKVPISMVGLHYQGGPLQAEQYVETVPPGTGPYMAGWYDNQFLYPTTLRNYIVSQDAEGDRGGADYIEASTTDNVDVRWEVATFFKLNTDKVREFHENIGKKYHAWCDSDENICSEGWNTMLNDSFRQQIENALQFETRQVTVDQIRNDEQALRAIQDAVGAVIKDRVAEVLGDEYFCGPEFVSGSGECPDFEFSIKKATLPQGVVDAYNANRESEILIQTRKNEVEQARLEAEAIRERQEALESCGNTCVLYEAIRSKQITFWVIEGDSNVTIPRQAPGG